MKRSSAILFGYILASIGLFLYSYTQVDLSLTLSQVSIWQTIQKSFQYIGFYQRPLSTTFYIFLLLVFFGIYFFLLDGIRKGKVTKKHFWKIIVGITVVLVLSYPAFSYDMFNYMFTAKTVLVYHKNPYLVIPLDFTGIEPWLSFMRWTHLPSAYTPFWISLTLPAYLFGFGFFLLIMWNIKILVAVFYLAGVWFIGKILHILDPEHEVFGMAVFAANPLIIIETLISGHNDIVMMAFAMVAIYLYLKKKPLFAFFLLSLSVAAKLITIFLIPVHFFRWNRYWALGMVLLGFLLVLTQRAVLPWYWVWVIPFVALLPKRNDIIFLSSAVSFGLLLSYAPFLFYGGYNPPVPEYTSISIIIPVVLASIVTLFPRSPFALQLHRQV